MRCKAGHLALGAACTAALSLGAHGGGVIINEIRIDQLSADDQEYFELKGPASTDLTGMTYITIGDGAGGSGVIEAVVDLSGQLIPADGHFLVAEASFNDPPDPYGGVLADLTADLAFENGDNVTHLLVTGFTGLAGDDLDTDDDGVLDVTPWSAIVDELAVLDETPGGDQVYSAITIGPTPDGAPGHVYRCESAGTWTVGRYEVVDTASAIDTPGDLNADCTLTPGTCGTGGDCFTGNTTMTPSPACDDVDCCNTVCAIDPFCCDVDWDGYCAQLANENCAGGDPCGIPGTGSCFEDNGTPGCEDGKCCDTVCAIDPDCCDISWDQACADLAIANCLEGPGDWVINEIHADPATTVMGGDANGDGVSNFSDDEFLEIYNNSGASANIAGWSIEDGAGTRHVFPDPTIVPADCVVVVFGGGVPTGVFGGAVVQIASTGALGLNNGGDTVTLVDDISNVITTVTYSGAGNDVSITRDPEISGPFVQHPTAGDPDVNTSWSPGTQYTGDNFTGCPDDPDMDKDGVPDAEDNCPMISNPLQEDCDDDGVGDACEDDLNGNGVPDDCEIPTPTGLVINEIRIDQPGGGDPDEFFELRSDTPNQSLDQLTYIVIGDGAGGSGTIEAVVNLTGNSTDGSGYFVAAESTFSLGVSNLTTDLNFENGDNVTHLLVVNFFGSLADDLDTNDDGTLDVIPWLDIVDDVAIIRDEDPSMDEDDMGNPIPDNDEWFYSTNIVGPEMLVDFNVTPGQVYRCTPDDTWTIGVFDPFDTKETPTDTPGSDNPACGSGGCFGDITDSAGGGPDGVVNLFDLLAVIDAWGPCPGCPEDITDSAEAGPDGVVNLFDLLAVIDAWGPCPK